MATCQSDTTKDHTGEAPAKGGAPANNVNALRNGASATIARLPLSLLPRTLRRQESNARAYRKELEAIVCARKGCVSLSDAHLINECAASEVHSSICAWLLRTRLETMSASDVVKCSEQILRSKSIRNRAFNQLSLDQDDAQRIESLYSITEASPPAIPGDVATNPPSSDANAPDAILGDCDAVPGEP